jgi:hypothetical protein
MTPQTDDVERRALWDEINTLKRERAQLRRELAAARGEICGGTAITADNDESESDAADIGRQHGRANLLLRYHPRAQQSLRGLPSHVKGEAITSVTRLASGDAVAWRGVKQAKDMRRPLYMARAAHEYRLLFRIEGGTLVLVNVVQRSQLAHAVNQLRSQA